MSMFEDRERAFEAKWAHDEEMQFRILVKRNELLGRWAGGELGLTGEALEDYVGGLVGMSLKSGDSAALYLKLRSDMGHAHSDAVILGRMADFLEAATLEAGLAQGRTRAEGVATAKENRKTTDGNVARADFGHILSRGDTGSADQEQRRHVRAAAAHRSKRT